MVSIIAVAVLIGGGLIWYFVSQSDTENTNTITTNTNSVIVNANTSLNSNINNTANTNTNQVVNTNVNQPTTNGNIDIQDNSSYIAGETVQVNEYMSPICSQYGNNCDQIKISLEVDLTEDSNGDQLTGKFYARAYLANRKVGEIQITQSYDAFCGDGGQREACTEDVERILTLNNPFKSNFYLTYQSEQQDIWYKLTLNNSPIQSSYSGRWIDFYYKNDVVNISFPQ